MGNPLKNDKLPYLTGLRAVAAYTVLLAHVIAVYFCKMYPKAFTLLLRGDETLAYFGMTLFFVLSGFVITYNYASLFTEGRFLYAARHFLVARFARLYPLYFLFLLVNLDDIEKGQALPFFLTLTQGWNNTYAIGFPHAWSISAEFFFYLCFLPIAGAIARLRDIKHILTVGLLLLIGSYTYLALIYAYRDGLVAFADIHLSCHSNPRTFVWLGYFSPYAHLCSFFAGCISARGFMALAEKPISSREQKIHNAIMKMGMLLIPCLMLLTFVTPEDKGFLGFITQNYLYAPVFACLFLSLARAPGRVARFLSLPLLIRGGEISYSVYILQHWIFLLVKVPNFRDAALSIVLTIVFSYGSYLLVEEPSRKALRRILAPGGAIFKAKAMDNLS